MKSISCINLKAYTWRLVVTWFRWFTFLSSPTPSALTHSHTHTHSALPLTHSHSAPTHSLSSPLTGPAVWCLVTSAVSAVSLEKLADGVLDLNVLTILKIIKIYVKINFFFMIIIINKTVQILKKKSNIKLSKSQNLCKPFIITVRQRILRRCAM